MPIDLPFPLRFNLQTPIESVVPKSASKIRNNLAVLETRFESRHRTSRSRDLQRSSPKVSRSNLTDRAERGSVRLVCSRRVTATCRPFRFRRFVEDPPRNEFGQIVLAVSDQVPDLDVRQKISFRG